MPVQLSFEDAERVKKQAGIDSATGHEDATWNVFARDTLRQLATQQQFVHVDDFYPLVTWHPKNPNAYGAIWQAAIRDGIIKHSGQVRPTKLPGKHAHLYPVYESLIYGQKGVAA